ncbi:hypothetical protein BU25DRAFT_462346 [Macroventuria anomochaeta]|uniref:Uncharacterized protein n=1 Tax=Macroventuria anomochaeta TaxID=301207 RepID=A0ACB6RP63_9PLEO|nr:uncharacterized protein BU25DRAFT_462346 [Macroventuria anomochaeta]KAF2622949.1 hypothetical protein BU25DRAFT_462346 [Macroventuria anomochaeta]
MSLTTHHKQQGLFFDEAYKPECFDHRRRNCLFDIEEGPTLESITDETGVPFSVLTSPNNSKTSLVSTATHAHLEHIADRRRRNSLIDIEEGLPLKQVADETGVPLSILLLHNPSFSPPLTLIPLTYAAPTQIPAVPTPATDGPPTDGSSLSASPTLTPAVFDGPRIM